jgi:hypothetical protein
LQIQITNSVSRLALVSAVAVVMAAAAVLQFNMPAQTAPRVHAAEPAGFAKMQLLRDEHETMRVFLAAQEAKLRTAAAIESEPEPESLVLSDAEDAPRTAAVAQGRAPARKPVRLAKAASPLSILPPPAPVRVAELPPPPPPLRAEPPRAAGASGWVHDATRLPRRLWAAVGAFMDDRAPPIPPRPIPPV